MPCYPSCLLSLVFLFAMIYFYNATNKNQVVQTYRSQLPPNLAQLYDKISKERLTISYTGYIIGLAISLLIIFYSISVRKSPFTTLSLVCITIVITFLTHYFYYILAPKSDWMLKHINSPEQTKAWLHMYRTMQYNYHMGFVFGLIAVGALSFAFRC